jgi:hypothetical protein
MIAPTFLYISLLFCATTALKHRAPVLDLQGNDKFRGSYKDGEISVSPEIRVIEDSGPICDYVLSNEKGSNELPFLVEVRDQPSGKAVLRLKEGQKLKCHESPYKLRIAAKRCDSGPESDSAELEVTVGKVNAHIPEFEQAWYSKTVEEGRLYGEILRLRATDADCESYGEICRYEITNNAVPFVINEQGVLKNTAPLNYSQSHSHILSIVAHDCGMKHSKPVLVTIKVTESCNLGVQALHERIDYYPGTGSKALAEEAITNTCGIDCEVEKVEGKIRIDTEHIGQGCDRESTSSEEQRRVCNVDPQTVDLLPPKKDGELEDSSEELENEVLTEAEGQNRNVYMFNGKDNAIIVQPETAKAHIPEEFTLSFYMKHDRNEKTKAHVKENILCSSDDHRMNRHHFSVYLRNCKLEMLIRREKEEGSENKFSPAEWRWTLQQVCDDEWHHYTIAFQFPQVDLYIDGRAFPSSERNPEILDDWPMHSTKLATRLTVGACWHGRTSKMAQFFNGELSNMLYLAGKKEHPGVLQCLHQCKEQLQFTALESLRPHQQVIFNNEQNEVTLRTKSVDEFDQLVRKVAYVNLRTEPTPGHRAYYLTTALTCKGKAEPVELPEGRGYIFVRKAPEPELRLTGSEEITRLRGQTHEGTNILPDLKILITQKNADGDVIETGEHKLDWCHIKVKPKLNKEEEYFSSPAALISKLGLDFEHDKEGLLLKGIEKVQGYQDVLEQIHYFNLHPEQFPKRIFVVQCSMLNGRVLSNELSVSMTIKAGDVEKPKESVKESQVKETEKKDLPPAIKEQVFEKEVQSHRLESSLAMDVQKPNLGGPLPLMRETGYDTSAPGNGGVMAGGAVAIVVVVCIGFLLVVIVIGILRMRGVKRGGRRSGKGGRRSDDDLDWDDSGMKIIVNPINDEVDPEVGALNEEYSEDDSDSDGDSFRDEDEEMTEDEEEEEMENVLPHVAGSGRNGSTGLDWDDSSLHPALHSPRARTYRV